MRADYAADASEIAQEKASRDRLTPRAAALREEIGRAPWDDATVEAQAYAYEACCDRVSSGEDFSEAEAADIRRKAGLPEAVSR